MAKNIKKDEKRFRPYGQHEIENPKRGKKRSKENLEERVGTKRGKGKSDFGNRDIATRPHYRGTNDVSWYASNDQLLRDVARLSFANPAGSNIPLNLADGIYGNTSQDLVERLPGIMTIECIPTYGIATDASSPLNQGAQLLYNTIRSENSGARNYDAPDLMHYIMGVDSLFIFYAQLLRLYGTINNFTFLNKYSPRSLVAAMGYDYDNIANNMAQLRSYINTYAKRLSSYIMPHNITIVERHFSMFGRVYKDSESPKAQYYLYVPSVVWKYNPIGSTTGAALEPLAMRPTWGLLSNGTLWTFADIVRVGDTLLTAMNDEDTLTMAGDMLKAFGDTNIWKQEYIDSTFTLDPVFDFTWLTQVQNLCCIDKVLSNTTMGANISSSCPYTIQEIIPTAPASPYLQTSCVFNSTRPILAHAKILISPYDAPTEGDVMESSRLDLHVSVAYRSSQTNWKHTVESCGAEIVNAIHVLNFINTSNGIDLYNHNLVMNRVIETTQTINEWVSIQDFARIDAFAMHPTIYVTTYSSNNANTALTDYLMETPVCDIDNWTVLHNSTVDALHKVALLSMLYVRNVGFYAKY